MTEDLSVHEAEGEQSPEATESSNPLRVVTSNEAKYRTAVDVFAPEITLARAPIDVPEIQSTDPLRVVEEKADAAYTVVGEPVLVDDFSFFVDGLNGFPGPLVKHLLSETGLRGLEALYRVGGAVCTLQSTVAKYDGDRCVVTRGVLDGTLQFASDYVDPSADMLLSTVFVPVGHELPLSELRIADHRRRAYAKLKDRLVDPDASR